MTKRQHRHSADLLSSTLNPRFACKIRIEEDLVGFDLGLLRSRIAKMALLQHSKLFLGARPTLPRSVVGPARPGNFVVQCAPKATSSLYRRLSFDL